MAFDATVRIVQYWSNVTQVERGQFRASSGSLSFTAERAERARAIADAQRLEHLLGAVRAARHPPLGLAVKQFQVHA